MLEDCGYKKLCLYQSRQMVCACDALNCITPYTFLTSLLFISESALSPSLPPFLSPPSLSYELCTTSASIKY